METIPQSGMQINNAASQMGSNQIPQNGDLVGTLKEINQSIKSTNDIDRGALIDVTANPRQTVITIASAAGGGAANITASLFNEDYLNATPTNNGSGAGSVVTTYNDGFSGNLISNITSTKGDRGLRVKQLQIKLTITASGAQDPAALAACNPLHTTYNGDATSLPQSIPLVSAGTPKDFQSGFLVVNVDFPIKRYSQLSLVVPPGDTATVIVVYA